MVPVLALFFAWVAVSQWIDLDSHGLQLNREGWNLGILGGGLAGFLAVLIIPSFWFGFPLGLIAGGVPIGLYVRERNRHVPEGARVLTARHLTSVSNRILARLGISLNREAGGPLTGGPPIQFIGQVGFR